MNMQRKPLFWFLLSLMCVAGSAYFWKVGQVPQQGTADAANPVAPAPGQAARMALGAPVAQTGSPALNISTPKVAIATNRLDEKKLFPHRLRNTDEAYAKLEKNERAILMMNASVDTGRQLGFTIPENLRAKPDSGSYVVQSKGATSEEFRRMLAGADATIISYIPNNAYLVRVSTEGAKQLAANPLTQSVLTYHPYYKFEPTLLNLVLDTPEALPSEGSVNLTLFKDKTEDTVAQIRQLGGSIMHTEPTPFGPMVTVVAHAGSLIPLAQLPGVQALAGWHHRELANDLDRVTLGVSPGPLLSDGNYMGLDGKNVMVNVNDTGADTNHPDLAGRIILDTPDLANDTVGHGTHTTGTILSSGGMSSTVGFAQGSVSNANFHGMATNATAFVQSLYNDNWYMQTNAAARTNVFISNNSWGYPQVKSYDIAAASFDAAVRDANPGQGGTQPICYVFSAGNSGGGSDDGGGGFAETILSPGTAKNVITVGAVEQMRFITLITTNVSVILTNIGNMVTNISVTNFITNATFYGLTDSDNQVAGFSSRGNVGYFAEGSQGRFKPDVVAPGTFVLSTRSTVWDQQSYYNPIFYQTFTAQDTITTNFLFLPSLLIYSNTYQVQVRLLTNGFSPNPFPNVPIYGALDNYPTLNNILGTNSVTLPNGNLSALTAGSSLYLGLRNPDPTTPLDLIVQVTILYTNLNHDNEVTLSNLNNQVGPWYRYESGTSMSAPSISGMLACMQQFFQDQSLSYSPALMKALLINSARGIGPLYDFPAISQEINAQGWGMPNLTNAIPPAFTNIGNLDVTQRSEIFIDQNPRNVLATGESQTYTLNLSSNGIGSDLRVSLVWTDPPGNPNAGKKLVNDLDLIITNLDTGDVFFGNDIPGGSTYSESWFTNDAPIIDSINNVENVFIKEASTANYTITVRANRVNVNALTRNNNGTVQDYALVISSGDGGTVTNAFTAFASTPVALSVSPSFTNLTTLTNGVPLFNQRAGANSQYSGSTNGDVNQWSFFVYTNTAIATNGSFTNVAFITFVPPELSAPRVEALNDIDTSSSIATRYLGADIDMYVSANPDLTNLNPAVISNSVANSLSSRQRSGTESVLITNAPSRVYYVAVKSEDQQGAQFNLLGAATDLPFNQTDSNGNVHVTMLATFPVTIPGGAPTKPDHALVFGVTSSSAKIRKVVVTNDVSAQNFGDYIGALSHNSADAASSAILNNHTFFNNAADKRETFVYDDSKENEFPGARTSDGPGHLTAFSTNRNNSATGVWMFTMVNDNSLSDTGAINRFAILIEPKPPTNSFTVTIQPNSWYYSDVDINGAATNLTIFLSQNPLITDLYIRKGDFPDFNVYDAFKFIPAGGGSLSINKTTSPILNPGRYFYGIYNPNSTPETFTVTVQVDYSIDGNQIYSFYQNNPLSLPDDVVVYSTNHVDIASTVVAAEVGVHLQHPRETDLVLTLISPSGTRVLLAENRGVNPDGTLNADGYGSGTNSAYSTNVSGGFMTSTTMLPLPTGSPSGTVSINYQFYTIPDEMQVYYGTNLLKDTGIISGSGGFTVSYGPGTNGFLTIVMNQSNNIATDGDAWYFTASLVGDDISYAIFSEDPTFSPTPIKFAVPPFGGAPLTLPATNVLQSTFDTTAPANYTFPALVDGWSVNSTNGPVTVVNVPAIADTTNNILALHQSSITRSLPTRSGLGYTLQFVSRGRPYLTPISWWRAEGLPADGMGQNSLVDMSTNLTLYTNGVVGQAFSFNGTDQKLHLDDTNAPSLAFSNSFSIEGWILPNTTTGTIFQRGGGAFPMDHAYSLDFNGGGNLEWFVNDTNHVIGTPAVAPIVAGVFSHVAATFNSTNRVLNLYVNGVLVNSGSQPNPQLVTLPSIPLLGVGIGNNGSGDPMFNTPFNGLIDELSVFDRELTIAEVQHIYASGSAGKDCNVITQGTCSNNQATANLVIGTAVKIIPETSAWHTNLFHFVAPLDSLPLTISTRTNNLGLLEDGILLDSFTLIQDASPNPANYYMAEDSLSKLIDEKSQGDWLLEIMDNRTGAIGTNVLVGWYLKLQLADTAPATIVLTPQLLSTNTVGGFSTNSNTTTVQNISYFRVDVPYWAAYATNLILNASGPVNLIFNQNSRPNPGGTGNGDIYLETAVASSVDTLSSISTPALQPGQSYYLAVENLSTTPVTFNIEVDFDITTLSNGVDQPGTILVGNQPRYYQFDVDTNAFVAEFLVKNPSGNVEMVLTKGAPLPDINNYSYVSKLPGTSRQTIVITTNSAPVPLSGGRWYIGVFNNDVVNVNYTIEAYTPGSLHLVPLTDGVVRHFRSLPGPAIEWFYVFTNTTPGAGILFEVFGMTNNVDLVVGKDFIPFAQPYTAFSANSGFVNETIVVRTNQPANFVTNDLTGVWYLGVPNNSSSTAWYNIRASLSTNGVLTNSQGFTTTLTLPPPAGTNGPTLRWTTILGNCYQPQTSPDLSIWTSVGAPIQATSSTLTFTDTNAIVPTASRYYRILQVPCP